MVKSAFLHVCMGDFVQDRRGAETSCRGTAGFPHWVSGRAVLFAAHRLLRAHAEPAQDPLQPGESKPPSAITMACSVAHPQDFSVLLEETCTSCEQVYEVWF